MRDLQYRRARRAAWRYALLATGALLAFVVPAAALGVQACREAGVGLESIVQPVAASHIALYDGKVDADTIDTVEPACCSSGIAVVLPAKGDPSGGSNCWAVIGFTSIDITTAKRSYDKAKGLLLVMPTTRGTGSGVAAKGPPLKLRINLGEGTVSLE